MRRRERNSMPIGILVVLVTLAAVLCIILGTLMYLDNKALIRNREDENKITQTQAKSYVKQNDNEDGEKDDKFWDSLLPADKEVDIAALKESLNPDVYAWLYIPDTGIDDPVLQNPDDALYYTTHNSEGSEDENGAIFSQILNSKDFSDNVTVIYGHNGGNGKGFSNLNLYADPEFFKSHPYIYVYTEDAVLLYQTFAAYEADDKHIILFYSTYDDESYRIYLQRLEEIAGISYNTDKENWPGYQDKILTLSTGVIGKDDRRLLVQAKFLGGFIEDNTNE